MYCVDGTYHIGRNDRMELNRNERPKNEIQWIDCVVCDLARRTILNGSAPLYGAMPRVSIMYVNFNLIDENSDCCERRGSTRHRLWEVSGCAIVHSIWWMVVWHSVCRVQGVFTHIPEKWKCRGHIVVRSNNVSVAISYICMMYRNYNTYSPTQHPSAPSAQRHIYSLTRMNFGDSIQ